MPDIRFRIKGTEEYFENPMDAVKKAVELSEELDGSPITIERGVKYKHRNDYEWYSLSKVEMPSRDLPVPDTFSDRF